MRNQLCLDVLHVVLEKRSLRSDCLASALALGLGTQAPLHAQAISPLATTQVRQTDQGGLTEIVVTAQKREQRLQDVPIAVTAVTAAALQANRITNVVDLSGIAPGLTVRKPAGSTGSVSFTLRGNVANAAAPGSDKATSTYLDGVYIGGVRGSVFDFPDIERIEVLRGPQGTLFGRNSTAGAVSVTTRDPTGHFHVMQEASAGNLSSLRLRTSVDLPQIGPFSAYVTYLHDEIDGDVRNLGAGTAWDRTAAVSEIGVQRSPKRLGGKNVEGVFTAVKFERGDLKLVYKFDYTQNHFVPEARGLLAINRADPIGLGKLLAVLLATQPAGGGPDGSVVLAGSGRRPDAINNGYTVPGVLRASGHNLTTTLPVSDSITLKNVSAYRKAFSYSAATIAGLDGLVITPQLAAIIPYYASNVGQRFLAFDGNNQGSNSQYSTEFQANYTSTSMTTTVGVLYYHENTRNGSVPGMAGNFVFTPVSATGVLPLGLPVNDYTTTKSLAGYAQGELHVTSRIDVVGGVRLTHDRRTGSHVDTVFGTLPFTYSNTRPSFSAGVNFKPSNRVLVYGKWANGFVSGGSIAGFAFRPETVNSWEAGAKTEFLDRRLRVNLALWDARYKGLQTAQGGASFGFPTVPVLVVNAGDLHARGAELEVTASPVQDLLLGGSLGYTHSKLRNSPSFLTVPSFGTYVLNGSPKWTANLNAQYEISLKGDTSLVLRGDGLYRSSIFADPNPDIGNFIPAFGPYARVPGRWLLNSRVAIRKIPLGAVDAEFALWGRNLTNNRSPTFNVSFPTSLRSTSYEFARTFGAELIFRY